MPAVSFRVVTASDETLFETGTLVTSLERKRAFSSRLLSPDRSRAAWHFAGTRGLAMAGVRVARRVPAQGGRLQQFVVVALMFMLLKSSHESAARAYRPRGLPGTRGGASDWRGDAGGGARGRVGGVHEDAGAADISSLKELTRVVDLGDPDDFDDPSGASAGTRHGGRGGGLANATDVSEDDDVLDGVSAPWTRASFPAPFPSDISGTFKGRWTLISALGPDGKRSKRATGKPLPGMHAFLDEGGAGTVVLQLRSRWDPARRVQAVAGEVSIRDGAYISDDDQHIKLEGVYVEPTGMLAALGESRIASAFADANATASVSSAAGDGDWDPESREHAPIPDDSTSRNGASVALVSASRDASEKARGKYREALRAAARDVTGAPFNGALAASSAAKDGFDPDRDGTHPETVPGSPGISQMQRNERMRVLDDAEPGTYLSRCSFSLKLWVEPGEFKPIDPASAADADELHAGGLLPGVPGDAWDRGVGSRRARDDVALAERRADAWSRRAKPADRATTSAPGEGGGGAPTLRGSLVSEECGFELRLTARWFNLRDYYGKATWYAAMVIGATAAQIYLVTRQTEHAGAQAGAARMSLLSIGWQAVLDSYQCLLHLTAGIVADALFHAFSAAAFLQFALFSVFEMRVMLQIWKARRPNGEQNWLEIRRDLSALYSRFYGGFLLGFLAMYWLRTRPWLIALLTQSYWLPQIAWSAWSNAKKPLAPEYVLGTSATRLLLPLYIFGCPTNFVRLKPQYGTCAMLCVWVALQVGGILAQARHGPRCFLGWVPEGVLPEVYDYHRPVDDATLAGAGAGDPERGEAGGVDCVICMAPVQCDARAERMVTPCAHFFHKECLERWMEVKMECPTCRGALPPL